MACWRLRAVKVNTRMQPRSNTAVERVGLFNLYPMVAINLHCIPTFVTTVRMSAVGDTIGLLLDDQEPALARAISDAFELDLT